jgi:hypothetical protein
MTFVSQKLKDSFAAPRGKLIWAALILFFVGAAICSFNPPSDSVRQIIQGEKTMNSIPENPTTGAADLDNNGPSPESMTATFAFG